MELIERINSLEKEIKVLKGEIKSILVDLRESMNLLENPFASIEHLKAVSGKGGIDEDILNRIVEYTTTKIYFMEYNTDFWVK